MQLQLFILHTLYIHFFLAYTNEKFSNHPPKDPKYKNFNLKIECLCIPWFYKPCYMRSLGLKQWVNKILNSIIQLASFLK